MKYILKPYQENASRQILSNLDKASSARQQGVQTTFALTAPTGAGKTVVATDVFERLLLPSDERTPDEKAVVIWFSDNPDLNRQSRHRIEGASSGLQGRTVEIDNSFSEPILAPGKIYFVNTQKFSKGSRLTGGKRRAGDGSQQAFPTPADDVQTTIWDILRNTLTSPEHNVYFFVDEAHRGAARQSREAETILQRLVAGHTPEGELLPVPAMPVVIGISATPGKFKSMMSSMPGSKFMAEDVEIPIEDVQESGLLKDTIELQIPEESGAAFEGVFVKQAAELLAESTRRWDAYHTEQGGQSNRVVPLMVVQMPDKATPEDLYRVIQAVREGYPEITDNNFAHVFGERATIQAGDVKVPYQEPQSVQDLEWIRVLFAKTAISTGWDCPRAEVMVSYRPAQDKDHITQIIGRMVRTPLARRIPGDGLLNSVLCLLPKFNRANAEEVVQRINSEDGTVTERAMVKPEVLEPVPDKEIWEIFEQLPREIVPKRSEKPIQRLLSTGAELGRDRLLDNGEELAQQELMSIIDGLLGRYKRELAKARDALMSVETTRLAYSYADRDLTSEKSVQLVADQQVIEGAYEKAFPVYTRALANMWVKNFVAEAGGDEDDADEATIEAYLQLGALASIEGVRESLWSEADKVAKEWLSGQRANIAALPDERQERYKDLLEMASEPSTVLLRKPKNKVESPGVVNLTDGSWEPYKRWDGMVVASKEDGLYPGNFNVWEEKVLETELARTGTVAWYRNPSHPGTDVVTAAYYDEPRARWRSVQPDFVFFRRDAEGVLRPEIIDPHGTYLGDALGKTQALARFAEKHEGLFMRIETVAGETPDTLQVLDLANPKVRSAVIAGNEIETLYREYGQPYR